MTGRGTGERGSSLLGTAAGVLVFLVFLTFVVQLLVGLYGRSVVTSVVYDGARAVAEAPIDHGAPDQVAAAEAAAEARMRALLGEVGRRARFDWSASDAAAVSLRAETENPRFMVPGWGRPLVTDHIDRTVVVRIEALR